MIGRCFSSKQDCYWLILIAILVVFAEAVETKPLDTKKVTLNSAASLGQVYAAPSADSSVKLLESVLARVHSVPQLALARGLRYQTQEGQMEVPAGPTDYRLAIRPKEGSLGGVAQSSSPSAAKAMASKGALVANFEPGIDQFGKGSGIWEPTKQTAGPLGQEKGKMIAMTHALGKEGPTMINDSSRIANRPASSFWERPSESVGYGDGGVGRADSGALSRSNERTVGTLIKGQVNGYAGGNSLSSSLKSELRVKGIQEYPEEAHGGSGVKTYGFGELSHEQAENSSVFNAAVTANNSKSKAKRQEQVNRSRQALIPILGIGLGSPRDATSEGKEAKPLGESTLASKSPLAYLPPNVVTGIPLLRLGNSERQAALALGSLVVKSKVKLNDWMVWSLSRVGSKKTALQVFMRHGQVEALRIFDNALIDVDFGVQLGTSLTEVKSCFGEPAFIVPEPVPGAGQNYIYPLSQVAFLLNRPTPGRDPQTVGLLIFDLK